MRTIIVVAFLFAAMQSNAQDKLCAAPALFRHGGTLQKPNVETFDPVKEYARLTVATGCVTLKDGPGPEPRIMTFVSQREGTADDMSAAIHAGTVLSFERGVIGVAPGSPDLIVHEGTQMAAAITAPMRRTFIMDVYIDHGDRKTILLEKATAVAEIPTNVTRGEYRNYQVQALRLLLQAGANAVARYVSLSVISPAHAATMSGIVVIGSEADKVFYRPSCSAAQDIASANRRYFADEGAAHAAGFRQSTAPGC